MSSISDIITSESNYTTQMQAKTDTLTGAASENLQQSDFLNLLTKQLQFQDPMSPQDNSQFISQMAQFSQLQSTNEMSTTLSNYSGNQEAASLVGKGVVLTDPNNPKRDIYGVVQAAYLDGPKSGITVNNVTYPLKYLLYSYDPSQVKADPTGGSGSGSGSSSGGSSSGGSSSGGTPSGGSSS